MRSFRFESVWLLSRQERKALEIPFHAKKNLILGRNHTGKSTLIKNLFLTLGATPTGKLERWDANSISLVTFTINRERYSVLHQQGIRALFDESHRIVAVSSSHREWSTAFAKVIGFNLVLTDKTSNTVAADPRCFFLPFYINQDGSWQSTWDTFSGLQQYKAPVGAILEYFSGIKPPKYYEVSSERKQAQQTLDELNKEHSFLERARDRLGRSASFSGPKLESKNFAEEIWRLTREVTELNREQETLRDLAVREQELLASLQSQIHLAAHALATYHDDSSFLRDDSPEILTCPTCGAEHARSFIDLLGYAEDARVLRELVAGLHQDEEKILAQRRKTQAELQDLHGRYERVSEILSVRRGDLVFGDVVSGMGTESALAAFDAESKVLKEAIGAEQSKLEGLNEQLKELTNKERTREILTAFREAYAASLVSLKMPPVDASKLKLTARPDVSGSGGPRSILAYYAALWQICLGPHGSFAIPLVIDSPNQQGQDAVNLPAVLKFIANDLPAGTQVIVGSEIETGDGFDRKVEFDKQWSLLDEEAFDTASSLLDPLVSAMFGALRREPSEESPRSGEMH